MENSEITAGFSGLKVQAEWRSLSGPLKPSTSLTLSSLSACRKYLLTAIHLRTSTGLVRLIKRPICGQLWTRFHHNFPFSKTPSGASDQRCSFLIITQRISPRTKINPVFFTPVLWLRRTNAAAEASHRRPPLKCGTSAIVTSLVLQRSQRELDGVPETLRGALHS